VSQRKRRHSPETSEGYLTACVRWSNLQPRVWLEEETHASRKKEESASTSAIHFSYIEIKEDRGTGFASDFCPGSGSEIRKRHSDSWGVGPS
jgi:hypothetical protein